ncbi:MAG TPA: nitrilase family protein [Edaphocola sp.]|nr:nitrilase family protein [Edaphocola sp.]
MKDLTVTCIQTELIWENKEANLKKFETLFQQIPPEGQVVILPEMFSTAFSMSPAPLAETMEGETLNWLKFHSKKLRKIITGSIIIEENGHYLNRLIWMQPDGNFYYYDKRHLFGFAGEDNKYTAGKQKVIVQVNGWKINLQICYDLRFPVWARQTPHSYGEEPSYDVLLYVANWPERRIKAWDTLLAARAIENQCYVVGVNRIGMDANDIYHDGSSSILDPWGATIWNCKNEEAVFTYTLSAAQLLEARKKFPFLKDGDRFIIS